MEAIAQRITDYCVARDIVTVSNAAWFKYGIEKRLSTLCAAIPLLIIATLLTSFPVSVAYYLSFSLIRRRANGYHARTWISCLIMSAIVVVSFLGVVFPSLNPFLSFALIAICVVLVFLLAPYDHKLMHFTEEEYTACQHSSRISICITASLALLLYWFKMDNIADAIVSGMSTATFLLCLGYINDWRKNYE